MIDKKNLLITLVAYLVATQRSTYATQYLDPSDKHNDTREEMPIGDRSSPQNFSGKDLREVELPKDLRGANLMHVNLSGKDFTDTNFEGAHLEDAILKNTTCNYVACFQDNVKANQVKGSQWDIDCLPNELKSIAQVYPAILQDSHKATLLQIASALAYLSHYEDVEFAIKVDYWYCQLLLLKKQLRGTIGEQLVCALANNIEHEVRYHCWKTDYPSHLEHPKGTQIANQWSILSTAPCLVEEIGRLIQCYLTEPPEVSHDDFEKYLQLFQEGLKKYNVESISKWGYKHYKNTILKNIQGLQKVYPELTSQKLRNEAIDIALTLSNLYKKEELLFFFHYLACQNRLLKLRELTGIGIGKDIHYNAASNSIQILLQ